MLDNTHQVETPEGIELSLEIAGLVPRALAFSLDLLIRAIIGYAIIWFLSLLGDFGFGLILLSFFFLEWFYPILFEVFRNGQTPGKKKMGLAVVHDDGTPISFAASMVRNFLRAVDSLPFLWMLGALSMLFNKDFKRLGDLAAGTLVVYYKKELSESELPESKATAPVIPLTLEEQRSLLSFGERHQQLSESRKQELCDMLPEQLFTKQNESRVSQVYGFAKWLRGH